MSILKKIFCTNCGFTLLQGNGSATYFTRPGGFLRKLLSLGDKKIPLPDPPAGDLSEKSGGKTMEELIDEGRIGVYTTYVCLFCCNVFQLASDKPLHCPVCKSENIESVHRMTGKTCPKCKEGVIDDKRIGIS